MGDNKTFIYSILPEISEKQDLGREIDSMEHDSRPTSTTVALTRISEDLFSPWWCTASGRMASILSSDDPEENYIVIDDHLSCYPSALENTQ